MASRQKVPKSFLTTREAAQVLGVSLRTVQLWAEDGLLSYWKTGGGHRRIPRESVERLLLGRHSPERVFIAATNAVNAPPTSASPAEPLHILVVEDEPTLLRLYRMKLASWTLQPHVTSARNGFEALIRIGSKRPDLLIADLYMPEMDGFQMLRELRAMPEMDPMEIVVVTGLTQEDIDARGGLPEAIPVLAKPIPFLELEHIAERIALALGRRSGSRVAN